MTDPEQDEAKAPGDPFGAVAVGCGLLGIVFFGILMAIVTAVLAAEAGRRAREEKRSLDNAYIAFVLSAVDGIVWIALQLIFELPIFVG